MRRDRATKPDTDAEAMSDFTFSNANQERELAIKEFIADASISNFLFVDADSNIRGIHKKLARRLGYGTSAQLIGKSLHTLLPKGVDKDKHDKWVRAFIEGNSPPKVLRSASQGFYLLHRDQKTQSACTIRLRLFDDSFCDGICLGGAEKYKNLKVYGVAEIIFEEDLV